MDRYLLVIAVGDHISRVHVVEHDLIKSEQYSDVSDGWVLILVRVDPFERVVTSRALDKHGVVLFF